MIVMDIGTARELLGVARDAVSSYYVETGRPAETDAIAERIERAVPGVGRAEHVGVQR